MPSSYTASARFTLQATGENLSIWGNILNNGVFQLVDDNVNGINSFTLSGTKTLTSVNGATDEARKAILNITGGTGGTITIPSVSKIYNVRNAASGPTTITTGGATNAVLGAGDCLPVFTDGNAVWAVKLAGLYIKDYIDTAILATTGSLPATTGNALKYLYCDGSAWFPTLVGVASDVLAGTSITAVVSPKAQADAAAYVQLTDAATLVWDTNTGVNAFVILGGNRTVAAPSHLKDGWPYTLDIVQDGTGSRTITAWDAIFDFGAAGAPVLSTGANKQDSLTFVYKARRTKLEFYGFRKAA